MKKSARGPLIYVLGFLLVLLLINWLTGVSPTDDREIDYSSFLSEVEAGNIQRLRISIASFGK